MDETMVLMPVGVFEKFLGEEKAIELERALADEAAKYIAHHEGETIHDVVMVWPTRKLFKTDQDGVRRELPSH